MKHFLLTALLICFALTNLFSQTFKTDYYFQTGNVNSDGINDMAVDPQGNIYIAGYFAKNVDFDPGPGTHILNTPSGNKYDAYVQKLDANYNLIWVKSFGGAQNGYRAADNILLDDTGNIYVSGYFTRDIRFEPNGPLWVSGMTDTNDRQGFLMKLDSAGSVRWAYGWSGATNSAVRTNDLTLDNFGNLYIIGAFAGTIDFDLSTTSIVNKTSNNGSGDAFVMKMKTNSDLIRVETFGDTLIDYGSGVHVYDDLVFLTGSFHGKIDVDFSSAVKNINSNGDYDGFIVKMDTGFNYIRKIKVGGTEWDGIERSIMTPSGYLINYGRFRDSVDFEPGPGVTKLGISGTSYGGSFVQVLDTSGTLIWAKKIESTGIAIPVDISAQNGELLLTGYFYGTCDLDPDINNSMFVSTPYFSRDAYVVALDSTGNFLAGTSFSSRKDNYLYATAFSPSNKYLIGGVIRDTMDIDPTSGVNTLVSAGTQYGDILFMELDRCEIYAVDTSAVIACEQYTLPSGQSTVTNSGFYTDMLQSSFGCDSTFVIDLIIEDPDDLNPSISLMDSTLIATAHGTNLSYQWMDCNTNQIIVGATSQSYLLTSNGNYAVIVTNGICTDTSACFTMNSIGIENILLAGSVTIYPNPTTGKLFVQSDQEILAIAVHDVLGREVLHVANPVQEIDLSALAHGVYLLHVKTEKGVAVRRVVKR